MGTNIGPNTRVVAVGFDDGTDVEHSLEERDVTIDAVRTTDACLERLSDADGVVIGESVPASDLVDCCRAIRDRRSDVPIVAFPADGSEALAGAVVAAGADGYVPRSQGVETLLERLDGLLADHSTDDRSANAPAATATDAPPPSTDDPSDRLELLVEQSPLAIIEWNLDFEVRSWNPAATDLFGYTADEAIGESGAELLLPDDDRRSVLEYWDALVGGQIDGAPSRKVNRNVCKDGTTVTCEWFNTPLVEDGEVVSILSFGQDITAEVKRATALDALQETTHELMRADSTDEIADIVMTATEDVIDRSIATVRIYDAETETLELAGVTTTLDEYSDEIAPIGPGDNVFWEAYSNQEPIVVETIPQEHIPYDIDIGVGNAIIQPLGDRGLLSVASVEQDELDDAEIHLVHVLATTAEAALDRIAFEKRLRAERDRFAALFENVPDAVVSVTNLADGPIVEAANPAFERLFGYDEAELVGEQIDRIIVPPDRRDDAETLNHPGSRGEIGTAEVKRQTADGLRDFRLRVVPMEMDGSSDRAFALYTDITEQKQRQKRLEILNRVLRHDLRNGMNIIDGCAEMLADAVDGADAEYVETIQGRAGELIGLAEKTRAVERVLDRDEVPAGPIDLTAAVERSVASLEDAHPDVDVSCSLPDRAFARADEYLQTAIFQVLENAVEHNDRDNPAIDVALWDCPDDELLTLSIADDGPGMPADERELLEGDREITQLRHASGLGLWLVNWVVTQTGGQLSFDDNEPRGTVVTLEVPRADAESIGSTSDGTAAGD